VFPDSAAARLVEARITVHAPELAAITRIAGLTLAHIIAGWDATGASRSIR